MERFWSKVQKGEPGECWLWTAGLRHGGYGQFRWDTGTTMQAHRVAFELTHGPIPDGQVVRHKCDVPGCCNPAHLELGTTADNNRDRDERGRGAKGGARGHARLTDEQVVEIRARYAAGGVSLRVLPMDYPLSSVVIGKIVRGETWKHV